MVQNSRDRGSAGYSPVLRVHDAKSCVSYLAYAGVHSDRVDIRCDSYGDMPEAYCASNDNISAAKMISDTLELIGYSNVSITERTSDDSIFFSVDFGVEKPKLISSDQLTSALDSIYARKTEVKINISSVKDVLEDIIADLQI